MLHLQLYMLHNANNTVYSITMHLNCHQKQLRHRIDEVGITTSWSSFTSENAAVSGVLICLPRQKLKNVCETWIFCCSVFKSQWAQLLFLENGPCRITIMEFVSKFLFVRVLNKLSFLIETFSFSINTCLIFTQMKFCTIQQHVRTEQLAKNKM